MFFVGLKAAGILGDPIRPEDLFYWSLSLGWWRDEGKIGKGRDGRFLFFRSRRITAKERSFSMNDMVRHDARSVVCRRFFVGPGGPRVNTGLERRPAVCLF